MAQRNREILDARPMPSDEIDTSGSSTERPAERGGQDFIRTMIDEDLRTGKFGGRVVTRFPPEPNGFLHIGHAKSICLNFGVAEEVPGGRCHLRFDDTNPETEDIKYVDSIMEDVHWLGFDWGEHLYFASDYFEQFYELAEGLIRHGKAYVDSLSEEEIREYRGTVSQPGRPSPHRDRTVEENLDLFRRMRAGEFPDGAHVLRARIDLASPNMLMRDPVLYRIRHASHYRRGDTWCIYPLYDYAHPLEDAIECVTHSLCTLEFENNREIYDWVVENCTVPCRPYQTEFARLALDFTVMSKRKLLQLVNGGHVSGWDDPRMPTIAGLRRRGVTPEAIRSFANMIGVAKANTRVDIAKLEYAIRDDLNRRAPRVMAVLQPLRVVITNYPEDQEETFDAPSFPHDVSREGTRPLPFSRTLFIERADFRETPPAGFFRLAPGREVRLRHAYLIRCDEVVKDDGGEVVELHCSYDPETRGGAAPAGRTVKGTLHWVSAAHALPCEVRLYDRLFTVSDPEATDDDTDFHAFLNPESLIVMQDAWVEPSVRQDPPGSRYQFERQGYFCSDAVDSSAASLVFNRTVTLRDTWAKISTEPGTHTDYGRPDRASRGTRPPAPPAGVEPVAAAADVAAIQAARREAGIQDRVAARSPSLRARFHRYTQELGLSEQEAEILTRDPRLADFFEAAITGNGSVRTVANWVVNELPRELGDRDVQTLPFDGATLARLVRLVEDGTISSSAGREILAELVLHGGDPAEIVERRGLAQVSDPARLTPLVAEVLAAHPAKVEQYRAGKTGLLGFFVGQVMGRTGGRANPEVLKSLLEDQLA